MQHSSQLSHLQQSQCLAARGIQKLLFDPRHRSTSAPGLAPGRANTGARRCDHRVPADRAGPWLRPGSQTKGRGPGAQQRTRKVGPAAGRGGPDHAPDVNLRKCQKSFATIRGCAARESENALTEDKQHWGIQLPTHVDDSCTAGPATNALALRATWAGQGKLRTMQPSAQRISVAFAIS